MSDKTAQQLLMGGGRKAINYVDLFVEVGGKVVAEPSKYHAREYDRLNPGQGKLKFFEDGNPVEGINIDVLTDEREDPNDDGGRRFYVEKVREMQAIRDAVREAGAELLEVGGYLFVAQTGEEMGQGSMPAKTFKARYIPAGQVPLMRPQDRGPRRLQPPAPVANPNRTQAAAPAAQAAAQPAPAEFRLVPRDVFMAMINAGLDVSGVRPE